MIQVRFLSHEDRRLYLSVYQPPAGTCFRGWVLHLPAFAEEMNKCRPMVNSQARQLAQLGYCVVVPDLSGTGDSSGEFVEAYWSRWCEDVIAVLGWISDLGGQTVALWGVRLGCLLALDVARHQAARVNALVLWQPVISGAQSVTQFLRLKMAAGLTSEARESTTDMRAQLASGKTLEVAGYGLSPELVAHLDKLEAVDLVPPAVPIFLAEIAPQLGRALSPMARKLVEAWADAGVDVESRVTQGAPFWSTQEVALVPELLEETGNWVSGVTSHLQCTALPSLPPSRTSQGAGEIPLVFPCDEDEMVGILHTASPEATTAVLVVVGGPQYRVGSHRQFVHLARDLARAGIPVLRFDYRGMGDSAGALRDFRTISEDIDSAMDALHQALPGVQRVVIWGLCDAATAACSYAHGDDRVAGLVLLNPWVHSEQGEARAYLKHYYVRRLFDAQFWKKMSSGDFQWRDSLGSLGENLNKARQTSGLGEECGVPLGSGLDHLSIDNLAERMYQDLHKFRHKVLLILSGNDLTAAEFLDASGTNRKFRKLLASRQFSRRTLGEADHTFSRDEWRKQVAQWTINWVKSL